MPPKMGISGEELRTRHSEEVQDLKRRIRHSEQIIADYRASHGSITTLFDSIKDAIPVYPAEKIMYKLEKTSTKKPTCGVALQITDTHYGAVQNKSEIEDFGEFSPEICEKRSMYFVAQVVKWVTMNRHSYTIDTAHVLVTGDLISGDIHLELQVTNAFPAPQQVVGSARLLASQISTLAPYFKNVIVHFVTEDNHARLTKKPQSKEGGINSFNYLVGKFAEIMLKDHENVKFNIYPQYEAVVNVGGRRYLLLHGHNIMGWAGIPFYGIERKVAKETIKRFNQPDIKRFHKIIMGHFHTPISTPRYWAGGSVSGTDAYDHKEGRYSPPSQPSWLVGKHGEFGRVDWEL